MAARTDSLVVCQATDYSQDLLEALYSKRTSREELPLASITNFTGAALNQQLGALDLRNAQSTQLSSDLLGSRLSSNLAPLEAVFGAGSLQGPNPMDALPPAGDPMLALQGANPLDALQMGPEAESLSDELEDLLEGTTPNLGAMFGQG